ncbi:AraC family transcriptional regulator [Chondromyces crocatus]|uniref:AraC family transcriptional regulator n=1 Tax=Chondromyces crocatus TaxID=52 RepID=A0A0K1EPZ4_CHOCO|nr:AraC family transcriptional regulator [Chondromyces crocatus]AKT42717.1 AraC family transcriptional regulator [Chondromyces crocatus]
MTPERAQPGPTAGIHDEILHRASRLTATDGFTTTAIPFLSLIRSSRTTTTSHGILDPSLCLVVQGEKRLHIATRTFDYGPGSYVVSVMDFPTSGQITRASRPAPYIGLRITLTPKELAAIIVEARLQLLDETLVPGPSVFIGDADAALQRSVLRLLQLLDDPQDTDFLAASAKREVLYRLLRGPLGPTLVRCILQKDLRIERAIAWLKDHFDEPLRIEALARASHMSVSSLQHKFKAATTMGPLQFQKQLRLHEARRLLLMGGVDAGGAAYRVGYESPSQFSREYRRLFGSPPLQDVKRQRSRPDPEKFHATREERTEP